MNADTDRFIAAVLAGDNAVTSAPAAVWPARHTHPDSLAPHRVDVPLGEAASKPAILDAFAQAFGMPRWFGHNWDALEECLHDLSWRPDGAMLVLVSGTAASRQDAEILMDILRSTCHHWQRAGRPFHVLVDPRLLAGEP
ncbi:barstar family protein [Nitrogeniibacter mangrovi]|uniref:Barstar family protein n=1 Tax=Nitrogeniibacter mangrovi TaxID=2016596 RepID=A0A6C1B6T0_9RHOO|nr:barstar family protein [Nitrogeniibacter mangrovi]QID18515.1 barstar family protein [Nitrogeniibacter mangrovi]